MLNTDLAEVDLKVMIYKVATSALFLVKYTDKRKLCKALYILWFGMCLSLFIRWQVCEKPKVTVGNEKSKWRVEYRQSEHLSRAIEKSVIKSVETERIRIEL